MKLNEKQTNIIFIAIGVLVMIVFLVLVWIDKGEIEELVVQIEKEQRTITELKTKESEIKKKTGDLYALQQNFNTFRELLPDQKKELEFYLTMEQFRTENSIRMWDKIRKVKAEELDKEKEEKEEEKKNARSRRTRTARSRRGQEEQGPFEEDAYLMSFIGSFNQLGELINRIERFDRFFSMRSIQVSNIEPEKEDAIFGSKVGRLNLVVSTFTFKGDSKADEKAREFTKGFEASPKLKKQIQERKQELLKKLTFDWSVTTRDPFDRDQILVAINKPQTKDTEKKLEPQTELEKFEQLTKQRIELDNLFRNNNILELGTLIKETKYKVNLNALKRSLTDKNDPESKMRQHLVGMEEELKTWEKAYHDLEERVFIEQLLTNGEKELEVMQAKYEEGRSKSSKESLQEVAAIYNKRQPQFEEVRSKEDKYPRLADLRNEFKRWYDKATIQLKVIDLAQNVHLKGVIYWEGNPNASVAFIEDEKKGKKVVRRGDLLDSGFEVQSIRDGEVVLRHKEEVVTIRKRKAGR